MNSSMKSKHYLLLLFVYIITIATRINGFTVTRKENGDETDGVSCTGTRVVRNDNTRSHFCATSMTDTGADCDLFIDGSQSVGVFEPRDVNNKTWTITKSSNALFSFCSAQGLSPAVGIVQIQDYPNNFLEPIWNDKYGVNVNSTFEFTWGENPMVSIKIKEFYGGHLVRIYFDCFDTNGTRQHSVQKNCAIFKYAGTITYPVTTLNITKQIITPDPPITSSPTETTTTKPTTTTPITTSITGDPQITSTAAVTAAERKAADDGEDWVLIGILIGVALLLILILLIVCLLCKRRKDKQKKEKVSRAENTALEENVSYRDNPTFVVLEVNDKKKKKKSKENKHIELPEYATPNNKIPTKGTGTVDSPDGSKVTSSAYLFLGNKQQQPQKPSRVSVPAEKKNFTEYDPVQLKIDVKNREKDSNIGLDNSNFNMI